MNTLYDIQHAIQFVVGIGITLLMVWAFVDCTTRKAPAFPAVGKLSKPAWLLLTGIPAVISLLILVQGQSIDITSSLLVYIATIISCVYLVDVRPAVREISGPSKW